MNNKFFEKKLPTSYGLAIYYTLTVLAILMASIYYLPLKDNRYLIGENIPPSTLFGVVVDDSLRFNPGLHAIFRASTILLGVLCLFFLRPWLNWLFILSFFVFNSIQIENLFKSDHAAFLITQLLVIQALWVQLYAKNFSIKNAYPLWCYGLFLFATSLHYTYSGLSKWYTSGFSWVTDPFLLILLHFRGLDDVVTPFLLSQPELTQALQITVLLVETLFLFVLWSPLLRKTCAVVLIGFHLSLLVTLGWRLFPQNSFYLLFFLITPMVWTNLVTRYRPRVKEYRRKLRSCLTHH